ncbi:diguanylate cyclase/phosphodiesterase (GGDEF & EAL domains) with PAS/PAC sensor(s) [hydrothermal vent metagenome]|uniref:Diguanylate cyclase/phosphodiesterase (GGDEF & EAL domains) with PAS/PAC sensor(S) n=1 Tax=hydrothermal vent metagenome TaxID=652676 RepID=A0A3B1AM01_9ZZZZ
MKKDLRLLVVEDSEDDVILMRRVLSKAGYEADLLRVENGKELEEALTTRNWDLVITDHNIPGFSSVEALKQVKEFDESLPVVIVSGSIGEDIAVAAMKAGAQDYIMKNNLVRLAPAIERELRDVETRRARKRAEDTIRHMAYHDSLTGLINRAEFERRLKRVLYGLNTADSHHALLYLDLDQFKIINDTCGHVAGDELLRQLTVILHKPIRESDTLARLGGDEFGILLENCPQDHAELIADNLIKEVKESHFVWKNQTFKVGASIGLVMLTNAGQSMTEALSAADMACYAAKDGGRNRYHLYSEDDSSLIRRHGEMKWVSRIHDALNDNSFTLYQQQMLPVDGEAGLAINYEFLVRLKEKGEIIAPGAFIPAAERYDLMPSIDRWVIKEAFKCIVQITQTNTELGNATYFLNLSGTSLSDKAFFDFLREQFAKYSLAAEQICFEVTETAAITNLASTVEFIKQLKELGCQFALDDFGAGLSSFSYLKSLPVDYLKIDGGFVRDMLEDPMDAAIVAAVNNIGHVAGLKTVAEFVENAEIMHALGEIGVDYAQGYALARPTPVEELIVKAKQAQN